jgi:spore germination protein KB
MQKEMISIRQAVCIITMFLFGSSVVMGVSSKAAQDSWLSLLLASAFAIPVILIYARIIKIFPEKDFFEIMEILLGKIAGKIVIVLMTWYAIHLGAMVLRNFSEFIQIHSLPETPQLPIMIAMILVVVYMAKSGIETMGKWSIYMLSVVVIVVILTILFSIKQMDFKNIMPIMGHNFGTIAAGSYQLLTFPFAETVLFLCIACGIKKNDSPYKLYIYPILIGAAVFLFIILRNILLLGPAMADAEYFPSYTAARVINVGDFFARVEGAVAMNFLLAGIIKITVCLMAASKGTARLFGIQDYRKIVMPVSLLVVALCAIVYENVMQMFDFLRIYQYYAIPFQFIIPLFIWIIAEIKNHKNKKAALEEKPS